MSLSCTRMGLREKTVVSTDQYLADYSDGSFWEKAKTTLKAAGEKVLKLALKLYFSAQDADTPVWAKTTIYSALGYFICTIDAIPDITPLVGFSDDLGALSLALATVAMYVKPEHSDAADAKLQSWFGESESSSDERDVGA